MGGSSEMTSCDTGGSGIVRLDTNILYEVTLADIMDHEEIKYTQF